MDMIRQLQNDRAVCHDTQSTNMDSPRSSTVFYYIHTYRLTITISTRSIIHIAVHVGLSAWTSGSETELGFSHHWAMFRNPLPVEPPLAASFRHSSPRPKAPCPLPAGLVSAAASHMGHLPEASSDLVRWMAGRGPINSSLPKAQTWSQVETPLVLLSPTLEVPRLLLTQTRRRLDASNR